MLEIAFIAVITLLVAAVFIAVQWGKSLSEAEHQAEKVAEYDKIEHERIKSDFIRINAKRMPTDYID